MPISSAHQFIKFSFFFLLILPFFTLPTLFCCQHFSSFDSRDRFRTVASCKSFGHLITASFSQVYLWYCKRLPLHWSRAGLHYDQPVVCLFVRHHAKNGLINRKMVVDCPPVITSICETLFQARQDQERGIIGPASLLHSWHWVLLFLGPRGPHGLPSLVR